MELEDILNPLTHLIYGTSAIRIFLYRRKNKLFHTECISARFSTCDCTVFQSGLVREAAWKSDWEGSPVFHQRSINILMTVSNDFTLTAGKIIPVSRRTMLRVRNVNVAEAEGH
jgi:hypothetical protein